MGYEWRINEILNFKRTFLAAYRWGDELVRP